MTGVYKMPASMQAESQGKFAAQKDAGRSANPYMTSSPLHTLWNLSYDKEITLQNLT